MIENFRNKVFNEDVLKILKSLPDNSLDMVYGDPDYNVGINYAGRNYTQKWAEYIEWYVNLATESMRVLKPTGNLFMMNYPKQNAYLRVKYLDNNAYDVSDYVWIYNTNVGHSPRKLTTAHRSILHATKSKNNAFYKDNISVPYDLVKNVSKDKTFHSCQIPLPLVEMLIKSCTREQDDCFILFGGSGSELVLCKNLKRNYISCELHPEYYQMILERLNNNGFIEDKYRIPSIMERKNVNMEPTLFDEVSVVTY